MALHSPSGIRFKIFDVKRIAQNVEDVNNKEKIKIGFEFIFRIGISFISLFKPRFKCKQFY